MEYFQPLFLNILKKNVHQCNTRQADDLRVPFARLNVRKFSIEYMVPKYGTLYRSI